jgi:ketosteroid isomerase-like protein
VSQGNVENAFSGGTIALEIAMTKNTYNVFEPADPYFNLVREALDGLVDGDHFFDTLADDIVYEVLYELPGWPRIINGRIGLKRAFRGYVDNVALQSAGALIVHQTDDGRVVVIEYEVHGTILATGVKYNNRFCSIIRIENRKVVHWRDYMDSLAAWNALTAPARQ